MSVRLRFRFLNPDAVIFEKDSLFTIATPVDIQE